MRDPIHISEILELLPFLDTNSSLLIPLQNSKIYISEYEINSGDDYTRVFGNIAFWEFSETELDNLPNWKLSSWKNEGDIGSIFKFELRLEPDLIVSLFVPHFSISIQNSWILPAFLNDSNQWDVITETGNSYLPFKVNFYNVGLTIDENGEVEFSPEFNLQLSTFMIGETGLVVKSGFIKPYFSTNQGGLSVNIPTGFKGVYISSVQVFFPEEWKVLGEISLYGTDLLIGNTGFSGTVGIEYLGTDELIEAGLLNLKLKTFSLTFDQNVIIESDVTGTIEIEGLKDDSGNDAVLDISINFYENGYEICASEEDGIPLTIPNILKLTLNKLCIGKLNGEWTFKIKGRLDRLLDIPYIGDFIPQYVDAQKFDFYESSPNDFDLTFGWKDFELDYSDEGVSAGYEKTFNVNKSFLKVLTIELVKIKLETNNDDGIDIKALADGNLKLGPIEAYAKEGGIGGSINFPQGGGNLGPADVSFDLIPPENLSLKVVLKGVTGGGTLIIDREKGRFAGLLHLEIKDKVQVTAVGVINTKDTNGNKIFSFIAVVNATFDPGINLGIVELTGLGGLVGLDRTVETEIMRKGLAQGVINNLLFPVDPIKNALTIINTLEKVFPYYEKQFAIGLLGQLQIPGSDGVVINLGFVLETGPKRTIIVILGTIDILLPDGDDTVEIHAAFIGEINFDKKKFLFNAKIFNSQVKGITIGGDILARVFWGEDRNFLVSVGGFHPAYKPPPLDLPAIIERLSLRLDKKSTKIRAELYMAVTSNAFQFGARADLYKDLKFGYHAEASLGLDTIFYFKPKFYMNVVVWLGAGIFNKKGNEVLGIHFDFMLEGPNPWHAKGNGKFKVWKLKIKIKFDVTIGHEKQTSLPPAVEVFEEVKEALELETNWQAVQPDRNSLGVMMKDLDDPDYKLLLHPLGGIEVLQHKAPLNLTLNKYGVAGIDGPNYLEIEKIEAGSSEFTDEALVKSKFAPSLFEDLDEKSKLTSPSYKDYDAGVRVSDLDGLSSACIRNRNLDFEEIVIDKDTRETGQHTMQTLDLPYSLAGNATENDSNAFLKNLSKNSFGPVNQISVGKNSYVIVNSESLDQVNGTITYTTPEEAGAAAKSLADQNDVDYKTYDVLNTAENPQFSGS